MIDSLATGFEKKILFGVGRHLWNVVGVAGVVAVVVGGTTLATSREQTILSYADWLKQEKSDNDPIVREILGQEDVIKDWKTRCENAIPLGDPRSYCDFYNSKKNRVANIEGDLKKEYRSYLQPLETKNANTLASRILSPLVISWGLVCIASASVLSAVLSVERNTRKD